MINSSHQNEEKVESPTPILLLLKAVVFKDERAIQAWRAWKRLVNEDDLDEGSHRILPLLHSNLSELGVDAGELEKYKQVHRFYWYKNQHIVKHALPLLQKLKYAGIDFLLLKGVPLAFHFFSSAGHRPFNDVDILVKPDNALQAYQIIEKSGFIPKSRYAVEKVFILRHSEDFRDSTGLNIDLHWDLIKHSWGNSSKLEFWENSFTFQFGQDKLPTVASSSHFFHTCIHGVTWKNVAPARWITDASVLLRNHSNDLDWDLIIKYAETRNLTHQLHLQLEFLDKNFELPIPREPLDYLSNTRRWYWEELETQAITQPFTVWNKLFIFWFLKLRRHPERSILYNIITFPKFVVDSIYENRLNRILFNKSRY